MEGAELHRPPVHRTSQKLPLWIIEHVWAHRMMDVQEVVDLSTWPPIDSQPLRLEDPWRLRVASAQVYAIVKNRDMEHFERVMDFLEATHTLLPRLVTPMKHMKIMFGLKTMTIMWMLREGRGLVDTVFKINQFFPNKLPQYQDHCRKHEMFLMRKNHQDFKALAHALAMDKDKLEDYITSQMDEQYGEHYARKVEDRLLHYLHELEAELPGDTYADKIMKKESPVTEEEKLLLEVITSDSTTIATTLKKLLHCDVASCSLGCVSRSSERGKNGVKISQLSKSVANCSSSKALFKPEEAKTPLQCQPEDFREGERNNQELSKDSPLLLENDNDSDDRRHLQTENDGEKDDNSQRSREHVQKDTSSPQFCSKHQRWVNSILQECPDECSEELRHQANVSSSPLLFQSSSSITSSQDLTPSDLIPCPCDQQHPPPQTSSHLQTAAQACQQANPEDKLSSCSSESASDTFQRQPCLPFSSRDTVLSPVVQLIDIASIRELHLTIKPYQASPNHITMSSSKQADSASSPLILTSAHSHNSGNESRHQGTVRNSILDQPEIEAPTRSLSTVHRVQTAPVVQDASTSTSSQPATPQSSSRLSRKSRRAGANNKHSQGQDSLSQNPLDEQFSSTSTPQSVWTANQIPLLTYSSQQVVPQRSIQIHPQSKTLPCSSVISPNSSSNFMAIRSETSSVQRAHPRLSLSSQHMLLQSKLLQPYVSLDRLSAQKCYQATSGRSSTRCAELIQGSSDDNKDMRMEEEGDADSSFDVNILYSSHSSSNDSERSFDSDPDYKPCIKKKRLLEYEAARNLSNI